MSDPPSLFELRRDKSAYPILATPSDHEESMGGVAAELLDEAVFPVEIGLHRAFLDIGALIGGAVGGGRCWLWDEGGGPGFRRAGMAAFEALGFPTPLPL